MFVGFPASFFFLRLGCRFFFLSFFLSFLGGESQPKKERNSWVMNQNARKKKSKTNKIDNRGLVKTQLYHEPSKNSNNHGELSPRIIRHLI